MDSDEGWGNSEFGGLFFTATMDQIGNALGIGNSTELPDLTVNSATVPGLFGNTGERVFPGDHDIVHGQHLYRPESKDIDLYEFQLDREGVFSAEIMAERLANSSQLDAAVTLFEEYSTLRAANGAAASLDGTTFVIDDGFTQLTFELELSGTGLISNGIEITYFLGEPAANLAARMAEVINLSRSVYALQVRAEAVGDLVKVRGLVNVSFPIPTAEMELRTGVREIAARNDDYFSEDSFLSLQLGSGRYYVGVTSTGNTNYDPVIEDSGIGGTTQGELSIAAAVRPRRPSPTTPSGTPITRRWTGTATAVLAACSTYWFKVATEANTLIVDKAAQPGGNGSLTAALQRDRPGAGRGHARPDRCRMVGNDGATADLPHAGRRRAVQHRLQHFGAAPGRTARTARCAARRDADDRRRRGAQAAQRQYRRGQLRSGHQSQRRPSAGAGPAGLAGGLHLHARRNDRARRRAVVPHASLGRRLGRAGVPQRHRPGRRPTDACWSGKASS